MPHTGQNSYAYLCVEGTKGAADPSTDQHIPIQPMKNLAPPKPKKNEVVEHTFDSLSPKIIYTGETEPGEGPLEGSFRDPFILLLFFTHKTNTGTWETGIGALTGDFTAVDDIDTVGLQYHIQDQNAAVAHVEKLLKLGIPMKYSLIVETGKLLMERAEFKFCDFETNTQLMSLENVFHDQAFGSGVGGFANWDRSGLGSKVEIATVLVTKTAAQITTGWYFTYSSGLVDYYVWMDKNGDGTTDDPGPIGTRTKATCNISGATTAADVATIIKNVLDALAVTGATVTDATVTITNLVKGNVTDIADVDTTFTFTTTQQGVTSGKRSVTNITLTKGGAAITAISIKSMELSFEVGQETVQIYSSLSHTITYRSIRNFQLSITGLLKDLTAITEYEKIYADRTKDTLKFEYDSTSGQEKYLQFTNAYYSSESDPAPIPESGKPAEVTLIIKGGEETQASFSGKWQYHPDPSALVTT